MSISVDPDVLSAIVGFPDSIRIQVQRASDPEAAAKALALAATDICGLARPKFVSPVSRAGTGPLIFIDATGSPQRLLVRIPDAVVTRLQQAGVTDATVTCPEPGGPLFRMVDPSRPGLPRAVNLVLCPPPPANNAEWRGPHRRIPDAWLTEAAAWVRHDLADDDDQLYGRIVSVEFPVRLGDAEAMLRQTADGGNSIELVSGTLGQRIRRALVEAIYLPRVVLSGGGPATTDDELVDLAEALMNIARRQAAEVAYAAVSVDPFFSPWPISDRHRNHGGEQTATVEGLCDEYVVDAYAYQVLGPGHLARLGSAPSGAEPLADGRVGLAVGKVADWLLAPPENRYRNYPSHFNLCGRRRDPSIPDRGRQLLAPCLLQAGEGLPLLAARRERLTDPRHIRKLQT